MFDLPTLKCRLDSLAVDAKMIAAALAKHAVHLTDPVLRGQLHRLETSLREFALAIANTAVPAGLS